MTGAKLRLLTHKIYIKTGASQGGISDGCFYFDSTMTRDENHLTRQQRRRRVNYMLQQSATGQKMQHFRQLAFHARALACCHDVPIHRHMARGIV